MRTGILLDETTGDLQVKVKRGADGKIVSGLVIGESDYQNIDLIVTANKGDFKEYPVIGVGAERYLKSIGRAEQLRREITVQLESDGYKNPTVNVSETGILEIEI